MHDPTFWQPLALDQTVAQNGLAVPGKVQTFIGAQWGHVRGFALPASKSGVPIDPGPPPIGTPKDAAYKEAAVDVIRKSAALDPADGQMIDIGLDGFGNNPLGTNDGHGYSVNPVTGEQYEPERVLKADYARVLAEFWADGPNSETPPGHWNVIANIVSDSPLMASRIGPGAANRLRWDVQMYFALNGAVHDAAIAAWGLKRKYQSVRPISMIRYMAQHGQSSDPKLPSYDPEGLPLIPGLIELITKESSAPGQRHAALADHVGEIAIRGWRGNPKDPSQVSGVGWIHRQPLLPRRRVHADLLPGLPQVRARAEQAADAPVGDVLRRRRSGGRLPSLRRHPHRRGRLCRPPDRIEGRQGGVRARRALLRRHGAVGGR
jgi:hypothetical protein